MMDNYKMITNRGGVLPPSISKGGAHWAESCAFSADSQQRGSEALLISEGLSDYTGGDSCG